MNTIIRHRNDLPEYARKAVEIQFPGVELFQSYDLVEWRPCVRERTTDNITLPSQALDFARNTPFLGAIVYSSSGMPLIDGRTVWYRFIPSSDPNVIGWIYSYGHDDVIAELRHNSFFMLSTSYGVNESLIVYIKDLRGK